MNWRWLLITWLSAGVVPAIAQSDEQPIVRTQFFGDAAEAPTGLLLFYLADDTLARPKLVVALGHDVAAGHVTADVFDAPIGLDYVPVTMSDGVPGLPHSSTPTITMTAQGSAWQSAGIPNYDLDILVRGRVFAMWGLQVSQRFDGVPRGEPLAMIKVRSDDQGWPRWDLRRLAAIGHFQGEGVYRMNYAERRCDTPLVPQPSISPLWPYVSPAYGDVGSISVGRHFEQESGVLAPPIVVDWRAGKIVTVSEIVTVRNQNCTYASYSFDEFVPGVGNDANAETPFAFYDLSGEGRGFPNLVLRTERYRPGDPWSSSIDPIRQAGRPTQVDMVNVRYSWALGVGDGSFDYKVDVVGPKPYVYETPIADGYGVITAPAYDTFPSWVIDQSWPAVAFIAVEGRRYVSNEGIYSWFGATELGAYATGQAIAPGTEAYGIEGRGLSKMVPGLRGEVVFGQDVLPRLYLSAIDNRLHLHGAVRGTWLIDDRYRMEVRAIPGAAEISHWRLLDGEEVVAQLVDFGDHFLLADASGVTLRANADARELFSTAPPTDRASWVEFGDLVTPYRERRVDPLEVGSWLDAFPGDTWFVPGATFDSPTLNEAGFQFILELGVDGIRSGALPGAENDFGANRQVLVSYDDGTFTYQMPRGPVIGGRVTPIATGVPGIYQLHLFVTNSGDRAADAPLTLRVDNELLWNRDGMDVASTVDVTIPWVPYRDGAHAVQLLVGAEVRQLGLIEAAPPRRVVGLDALDLPVRDSRRPAAWVLLLGLSLATLALHLRIWRLVS